MTSESPIRIGFISRWNVHDNAVQSGMPASAWRALSRPNVELIHLHINPFLKQTKPSWKKKAWRLLPLTSRQSIRQYLVRFGDILTAPFDYQIFLSKAIRDGQTLTQILKDLELNALFGVCVSSDIYALETDLPIIYATDATARLINSTYPEYIRKSQGYHRVCDEFERVSLQKVSAAIFASQCSLDSAVQDYNLSEKRAFLVPLGANVVPRKGAIICPDAPSPAKLELIIVAADPKRKRLGFCLEIAEILVKRGIETRLNYIGPSSTRVIHSSLVNYVGFLNLSDDGHYQIHQNILAKSHFLLLPSIGEMYGIAPCEAAHFGRPSLVSDVGGLPTVVLHNQTGFVLPFESSASDYADKIEELCYTPKRYMEMSNAARNRAVSELNWDTWGCKVIDIIRTAIDQKL